MGRHHCRPCQEIVKKIKPFFDFLMQIGPFFGWENPLRTIRYDSIPLPVSEYLITQKDPYLYRC